MRVPPKPGMCSHVLRQVPRPIACWFEGDDEDEEEQAEEDDGGEAWLRSVLLFNTWQASAVSSRMVQCCLTGRYVVPEACACQPSGSPAARPLNNSARSLSVLLSSVKVSIPLTNTS